jgi:hypothetical protein
MSGSVRTQLSHLRLVGASHGAEGQKRTLLLLRSPRLERFAAAAAAAGLDLPQAVRFALEHGLALQDAAAFGLDADTARRLLNRAAAGARATRPLGDGEAARLRRLTQRAPRPAAALPERLKVKLDDRTSTRVRDSLNESAIRPAVVEEMISWQVAATLEGRTVGEWALHTLARGRRAA